MEFTKKYEKWLSIVNEYLRDTVILKESPEGQIYKAMKYSLDAGGKRLRPVLFMAVNDLLGGNAKKALPYACGIELIHTYSLIHDDLPAMDDDDYRRGRLSNHRVFGEAIAILAGDALLNRAFEIMLEDMENRKKNKKEAIRAASIIAGAAGTRGMIGGQAVDILSEGRQISSETLKYMHRYKTGALIKASVMGAAALNNASVEQTEMLEEYSENTGIAFQIKDDIMDEESCLKEMGKAAGRDKEKGKSTYVSIYGIEKAKEILMETIEKSLKALEKFGEKAFFLREMALYTAKRKN